jgi:hypothetical protein
MEGHEMHAGLSCILAKGLSEARQTDHKQCIKVGSGGILEYFVVDTSTGHLPFSFP